eukprot:scaffold53990_cov51-Phaeocystis_antarctica.AAC.1
MNTDITGMLVIPANVETIGRSAFYQTKLAGLDLSQAASLVSIGAWGFSGTDITGTIQTPFTVPTYAANSFPAGVSIVKVLIPGLKKCAVAPSGTEPCWELTDPTMTDIPANFLRANTELTGTLKLGAAVKTIGSWAFDQTKLAGLDLSDATSLVTIGEGAFFDTDITGTLVIPAKVETIGEFAFYSTKLTGLDLSQAASLVVIGAKAFLSTDITAGTIETPFTVPKYQDNSFPAGVSIVEVLIPGFAFTTTAALKTAVQAYNVDPTAAIETYGPLATWDVSAVADMSYLFYALQNFNADVSNWDTSSVTDMRYMFQSASAFNQPLSFDTSSVTTMYHMFFRASAFNQPLSFDTTSVTSMDYMFIYASAFNQPLTFDTSSVTTMYHMFFRASAFNQPLSFDTTSVTRMDYMFIHASAFNQPLTFDTSSVTNMGHMFIHASAFNQPLSFDTTSVTIMDRMFLHASAFNQPLTFDTSRVTNMDHMFTSATSLSNDNKLRIRCAWADTPALASAGYGSSWGPGTC